jgi:hypothetical protein
MGYRISADSMVLSSLVIDAEQSLEAYLCLFNYCGDKVEFWRAIVSTTAR